MSTTPADSKPRTTNVVVWAALALAVSGTGIARLAGIYPLTSPGFLVSSLGAIGRGLALGGVGLMLETSLRDRSVTLAPRRIGERFLLNTLWTLALVFGAVVAIDGATDAFLGYHVTRAIRILFSDGVRGMGPAIEAVGMSPGSVLRGALVLLVVIAGLYALFKGCAALSSKLRWNISRRAATVFIAVTFAALIAEQLASPRVKTPAEWERELRAQPLEIPAAGRPEADLASFSVHVPVPELPSAPDLHPAPGPRPDILMIIIESFRRDAVDERTTPELLKLLQLPRTRLLKAATSANVTHFAWYGMFTGTYPLAYNHLKALHAQPGSLPLMALAAAGYDVRVFTTSSLDYQELGSLVFGPPAPWLHLEPQPLSTSAEEKDREIVDRFVRELSAGPPGGRFFVLGLNSSHFDYAWPADFSPPPGAVPPLSLLEGERAGSELLHERYRHALAWVDNRAGFILETLRAQGRLEHMMLIVTGDHGEAFNEHGVYAHGTDLSREQVEVPLFVHLPVDEGAPSTSFPAGSPLERPDSGVAHVDIMPTILEELGLFDTLPRGSLAGQPLQRPGPGKPRLSFQGWSSESCRFALLLDGRKLLLELDSEDPFSASRLRLRAMTNERDEALSEPAHLLEWTAQLGKALPFLAFP